MSNQDSVIKQLRKENYELHQQVQLLKSASPDTVAQQPHSELVSQKQRCNSNNEGLKLLQTEEIQDSKTKGEHSSHERCMMRMGMCSHRDYGTRLVIKF